MASNRKQKRSDRKDITLMTILANEATADSRKLLKKYNRPDATNHSDLEQKLAELYFNTSDKVQLEKEMAAIHPHRKWLQKYIEPTTEVSESKIKETSGCVDGDCCESCRQQRRAMNRASCPCALNRGWEQMSNADGNTVTKQSETRTFQPMEAVVPIALFGIITIGIIAMMKTVPKA